MIHVTINGEPHQFAEGVTILRALQELQIKIPALCDDPRLAPAGACRLCVVELAGVSRPVTACNTKLTEGMEIQTHSRMVEQVRKTILRLLSQQHTYQSERQGPELAERAEAETGQRHRLLVEQTHPYIRVDMSRCIYCMRCVRICEDVQGQYVWRTWNRGDATRLLPAGGRSLLESSCVSCGTCVDGCPSGALEDRSVVEFGTPTEWTRTTCPYCGVGCELRVGTRRGRITQVKPAWDAPVNKGHLCVKGRYAFEFNYAKDRIIEVMIRSQGKWKKASWAEAMGFAAERLEQIVSRYGPDSVGVLGSARGTNEENYLAQKFTRAVLGTNNVDCCARVCHAPTAAAMKKMLGTGAATNSFEDIEKAAGFLLCGTNTTENHPIIGARIKQAVRRGAKLIVIDPRRIELAKQADIHLAPKPGTNVALLNALACVIVQERLYDSSMVQERTIGWEEFAKFVQQFTPERIAAVCGVEAKQIVKAAELYAQAKPAMCFHGLGLTEQRQGSEGVMCLVNLALLTGNIGKEGAGVNPLRGQNNVQGAAHMGGDPLHLPGYVPVAGCRERFEKAWKVELPRTPGRNVMQMLDRTKGPELKGLWSIGYDLLLSNPNVKETSRVLKGLEFVIVQDLFMNETAKECGSVFFPAASSYEKEGTFMNSERRVQRVRKAVGAPGEAKADWEIICEMARSMGAGDLFRFNSPEEIWEEIRSVWPAGSGITYARLEKGGLQWPCPGEEDAGTVILHRQSFSHGPRAFLQCIEFKPSEELGSPEYPFILMTGRSLYQFNAGTMTMRTGNTAVRPGDTLDMAASDAERLGVGEGDRVRIRSRYGEVVMPVKIDPAVKSGEVFATFHTATAFLNRVTGSGKDPVTSTPEYKVTAVKLTKETQPYTNDVINGGGYANVRI